MRNAKLRKEAESEIEIIKNWTEATGSCDVLEGVFLNTKTFVVEIRDFHLAENRTDSGRVTNFFYIQPNNDPASYIYNKKRIAGEYYQWSEISNQKYLLNTDGDQLVGSGEIKFQVSLDYSELSMSAQFLTHSTGFNGQSNHTENIQAYSINNNLVGLTLDNPETVTYEYRIIRK